MNEHQQLMQLKAEIYDANLALKQLNEALSEIVKVSGLTSEDNITIQDVIERITYLVSLEDKE